MIIEVTICDYLENILSIPTYLERPVNPEGEYILVEKTGSSRQNCINQAMIAVQSIVSSRSGSMLRASEINELVKAAMYDLPFLDEVASCRLNSDYNFTNTDTAEYRYQAVFDVIHY